MQTKNKLTFVLLGSLVLLGFVLAAWKVTQTPSGPPQDLIGVLRPEFRPFEPFKLVDHHNAAFNQQSLEGKWSFVFFGYTSCPDICPLALTVLNTAKNQLDKQAPALAKETQVLFVSVDPQRDSVAKLAEYVSYFNKDFVGVTGEKQQIDNLAKQFGAGYFMEAETVPGEYLVGHTSAIFLVDPAGRLIGTFSQPHQADTIVAQYGKIRAYIGQ